MKAIKKEKFVQLFLRWGGRKHPTQQKWVILTENLICNILYALEAKKLKPSIYIKEGK